MYEGLRPKVPLAKLGLLVLEEEVVGSIQVDTAVVIVAKRVQRKSQNICNVVWWDAT